MADRQLDFFGGSTLVGPPKVPAVTYHQRPARRHIRSEARIQCGHCVMNARNWRDNRLTVPQWATESQIIILQAVLRITQTDGSTLDLCAQHAQEHEERGDRRG